MAANNQEKDGWEKFGIVTQFVSGVVIAIAGGVFSYSYQREQTARERQAADKHLGTISNWCFKAACTGGYSCLCWWPFWACCYRYWCYTGSGISDRTKLVALWKGIREPDDEQRDLYSRFARPLLCNWVAPNDGR